MKTTLIGSIYFCITAITLLGSSPLFCKRIFVTIVTNNKQSSTLNGTGDTTEAMAVPLADSTFSQDPISVIINPPIAPINIDAPNAPSEAITTPDTTIKDSQSPDIHINVQNSNTQQAQLNNTISSSITPGLIQETVKQASKNFVNQALNFCWNHQKTMILCTLVTSYLTLLSTLRYQDHKVRNLHWAHWGAWNSPEEVAQLSIDELAQNLYLAIQHHYETNDNHYGFLSPIILFLKDIECETARLNRFCRMHQWLGRIHLTFLFPTNTSYAQAMQMKDKLNFLKETLLTWMHYDTDAARYRIAY